MRKTLPLVGKLASQSFTKLLSIMSPRKSLVISMSVVAVLMLGFSIGEAQFLPSDYPVDDPFNCPPELAPCSSAVIVGSGQFECEFNRHDIPGVLQDVQISLEGQGPLPQQPATLTKVIVTGLVVCGLSSANPAGSHLSDYVYFKLPDPDGVTFHCPTITTASGGSFPWQITQDIASCLAAGVAPQDSITGSLVAVDAPAPVGPKTRAALVAACGQVAGCTMNTGFPVKIALNTLTTQVCGPNGQTLGFSVTAGNPGRFNSCFCTSHLAPSPGGAPVCDKVQGVFPALGVDTAGATACTFIWQKTGTTPKINASGPPSTINAAILDSPTCPVDGVNGIDQSTLRVCGGVIPDHLQVVVNGSQKLLSMQFSEGDCRNSFSQPLQVGSTIHIDAFGNFKTPLPPAQPAQFTASTPVVVQ